MRSQSVGFRPRLGAARMARGNQRDQAREKAAKANKVLLFTNRSNILFIFFLKYLIQVGTRIHYFGCLV